MQYTVSVRSLCEFGAKQGDLDVRFTPSPTAQEGMAGHQLVASRRPAGYETEIGLQGEFDVLVVRGRADGFDPARNRLEEIKTHRADLARQPANHRSLHWAQAKVYAALMCEARALPEIEVSLVYFNTATQQETTFNELHTASSLRSFFESLCRDFLVWAQRELAHRQARDAALSNLRFPHAAFRHGQRELAESVFKGAASGRCLMAQATTGIGKTVGTLFGMLKAAAPHRLDKVFYLTAKSTGRALALDAMRQIAGAGQPPCRVQELTARDKACEHPDKSCQGDSCPLARGFYDRLPAARAAAVASTAVLDAQALRSVALAHQVCPYYLGQELARWSDVLVGDYNYFFDGSAMLYALTVGNEWRVGVLADEAHNLIERAREMYSATLGQANLRAARTGAPAAVRTALDRVNRAWGVMHKASAAEGGLDTVPRAFVQALKLAAAALETHLAEGAAAGDGRLQEAYFEILAFLRLLESFGDHSVLELGEERASATSKPALTLRIQNLIPAPFLKPRFAAARTVTLFSATISAPQFYEDVLGLPTDTAWLDVPSPFSPEQLEVHVVNKISTRFEQRQNSAAPIAQLMAQQLERSPGNYLAFFSSFDYLSLVAAEFESRFPSVPSWRQARGMTERERAAFLERFAPGGQGLGFAVLGGSFGEGVDLPGDRLIGAFVATLGLPQVNPRNEKLKTRLDEAFGAGYDYAYLYPGLQKVVQAAGRVIRTREDRGVVYLIDERFARPKVRQLLPKWWHIA